MLDASVKMGLKRKLDEAALEDDAYHDQRQAILNISMFKLKSFSASKVEPSLLHSVLIYNTLKYIEHELTNEGLKLPAMATPPSLTIQNGDTLDAIPASAEAQDGMQKLELRSSSPPARSERSYHSMSPPKLVPPRDDVTMQDHLHSPWSPLADPPSLQPPSEKLPKLSSHLDYNSNTTVRRDYQYQSLQVAPSISKTVEDDPFADIDLDFTLYDFDLFSPMAPKLPPISTDELCHVIPQAEAYSPAYFTSSNVGSCKTDVISDDLDHIMQVLVGM